MKDSSWRYIYGTTSLVISICAFLIAYFCYFIDKRSLASIFYGGILFLVSILHLFPMAHSMLDQIYPFTTAISLFITGLLTLFNFIHQSLQLVDETYLVQCENSGGTNNIDENSKSLSRKYFGDLTTFKENLPIWLPLILFFVFLLFDQIMLAVLLSSTPISHLHECVILFLSLRFIIFTGFGSIIREQLSNYLFYIIFAFILSVTPSIFLFISFTFSEKTISTLQITYGISTSCVIGFLLFYGGKNFHSGLSDYQESCLPQCFLLFLTFLLVTFLRALTPDIISFTQY